jgi:hypothetical protein
MRLAGNHAEVAACCAEWEFKSKLNYAFQELGNSIGKETRGVAAVCRSFNTSALLHAGLLL